MINSQALARRISAGIYGRLEFDFACERGHGFSETYVHGVLNEILSSVINPREINLLPSYADPALQNDPPRRGRKREVDVALIGRDESTEKVYIEAKWAKSGYATPKNILVDLCRLALLRQAHPDAICLFVLAGPKGDYERLFASGLLAPVAGSSKKVIDHQHTGTRRTFQLTLTGKKNPDIATSVRGELSESLPRIPDKIVTMLFKPSHQDPPDWSVNVWSVSV